MASTQQSGLGMAAAGLKPFLAVGMMLVIGGLVLNSWGIGRRGWSQGRSRAAQDCEQLVRSNAQLSREQLAQLLTVPERDPKANVRKIVAEPYCRLPQLQVRAGVVSEREAYPLAWDPSVSLVILYENDEYAGYRFRLR